MSDSSELSPSLAPAASASAAAVAAEPCPTPLEWRVVLDEFRRQARPFDGSNDPGSDRVTGITFGTGAPLFVLGPAAGDRELFALLAWLLKDDYSCVFVDLPQVRWPVNAADELARHTQTILAAADHLGHDRFVLLGVAYGSALAFDLVLNNQDRVAALVLLQAAAKSSPTWLERGLHAYGSLLPGVIGGIPGWWNVQRQNHRPWFPPFDDSRFDFLTQNLGRTPTAQYSRRMRLWSDLDFRDHLDSILTPMLLIETEGDGPHGAQRLLEVQSTLANSRTESLHSSGLYPYLTHPHRVAKLMRTFLCGELASRVP